MKQVAFYSKSVEAEAFVDVGAPITMTNGVQVDETFVFITRKPKRGFAEQNLAARARGRLESSE